MTHSSNFIKEKFFILFIYCIISLNLSGQSNDSIIIIGINKCYESIETAEYYFEIANLIEPNSESYIYAKIDCYLIHDQIQNAVDFISGYIINDSLNPQYYFIRGNIYESVNMDSLGILDYQKALIIDTNYIDAEYNIASVYINRAAELGEQLSEGIGDSTLLINEVNENLKLGLKHLEIYCKKEPDDIIAQQVLLDVYKYLNLEVKRNELE